MKLRAKRMPPCGNSGEASAWRQGARNAPKGLALTLGLRRSAFAGHVARRALKASFSNGRGAADSGGRKVSFLSQQRSNGCLIA